MSERVFYELSVATKRNAKSSPLMTRVFPVTLNVALDRMSSGLLPTLTSTGPTPGADPPPASGAG
jgi:hypothetical protein